MQTDRQAERDTTKPTVAFRNLASAHKTKAAQKSAKHHDALFSAVIADLIPQHL